MSEHPTEADEATPVPFMHTDGSAKHEGLSARKREGGTTSRRSQSVGRENPTTRPSRPSPSIRSSLSPTRSRHAGGGVADRVDFFKQGQAASAVESGRPSSRARAARGGSHKPGSRPRRTTVENSPGEMPPARPSRHSSASNSLEHAGDSSAKRRSHKAAIDRRLEQLLQEEENRLRQDIAQLPSTPDRTEDTVFTQGIPAPPLTDSGQERENRLQASRGQSGSVGSSEIEFERDAYANSQGYKGLDMATHLHGNPYQEQLVSDEEDDGSEDSVSSDLHKALGRGEWRILYERLLSLEYQPDTIVATLMVSDTERQSTILHTAVWKAPSALTKCILDMIYNPRDFSVLCLARDSEGNTPLHLCCANLEVSQNGKIDLGIIKQLAQCAPRAIQMQNAQGDTPLHLLVSSLACCDQTEDFATEASAEAALCCLMDASVETAAVQDCTGATPLHVAIGHGAHERVLMRLLEMAPTVAKVPDERGMLPLHYVAAFPKTPVSVVKLLVQAYPEAIVHVTVNGDTPLHILASNAFTSLHDLATTRLDRGTAKLIELLMGTSSDNDEENQTSIMVSGAQRSPLLVSNLEKLTPLHCCALFDTPPNITRFIMKNPVARRAASMTNVYGATPLHLACAQPGVAESIGTVVALGTAEAAGVLDRLKRTPLHVAAQNIHATGHLIKVLADLCPEATEMRTQRGHLPLHLAAQSQAREPVIKALIRAYPKATEARNKTSNTPLHDAAKYRASPEVVKLLLETYNDAVYIQNQYGNLPLHCATAYQAPPEVVQLLLQAWPDGAAMQNHNQDAPLHYAAAYATSAKAVKPLIDAAPAAVLLLNSSAQSPIDRAKENNAPAEIIKLLEESAEEWTKKASTDGWGAFSTDFDAGF